MHWFPKATRRLDRLGIWYGGYAMLTGIVGWLAKQASWLGSLNWAEAALIGLFGSALLMLITTAGLALYRLFNPLPARNPATAEEIADHPGLSEEAIAESLDARIGIIPNNDPTVGSALDRLNGLIGIMGAEALERANQALARLEATSADLQRIEALAKAGREYSEGASAGLLHRLGDAELKLDRLIAYVEQRTGELSDRFANVDAGFAAILDREWNERLFHKLGDEFDRLAAPVMAGGGIASEAEWQRDVKTWRAKLDQWLILADHYAMNARDKILAVPEFIYDRPWPFDEKSLTANQAHRYKEMAVWWQNAQEEKPRIDQCLAAAAFEVPSKKGRTDSPPRLGGDR